MVNFSSGFILYVPGKVRIVKSLAFEVIADFSALQGGRQSVISIVLWRHFFLASVERAVAGSDRETSTNSFYVGCMNYMR